MEKSKSVLVKDKDSPIWYVYVEDEVVGPLSHHQILEKIGNYEILWVDYIWAPRRLDWKRIADLKQFKADCPKKPARKEIGKIKKALSEKSKSIPVIPTKVDREWFLYYNQSQFGPFSKKEVIRLLEARKIHPEVFTWNDGMTKWVRLHRIPEFDDNLHAKVTQYKS